MPTLNDLKRSWLIKALGISSTQYATEADLETLVYASSRIATAPIQGTGSPEGVITAPVGTEYVDTDATGGNIKWVKATGSGNTGWVVSAGTTSPVAVTPVNDSIMQAKAGAWSARTLAQIWTDLKDLTVTLTNKRITKRVFSTADTATLTIDSDSYDMAIVTALAQAMTIAAPTGTPTVGQGLIIRIKDNGTARALTWNAAFVAVGVTLPTTTVINKVMYLGTIWNATTSKWDVISLAQEA